MQKKKKFLALRGAIIAQGFTMTTLAEKLGISLRSLSNKMMGYTEFTLEEIVKICDITGINADIFFEERLQIMQLQNGR